MNRDKFFFRNMVLHSQNKVSFLHVNARPHVAEKVKNLLKGFKWEVLTHPSYSPVLAPSDYHLFLFLSHSLNGKKFESKDQVKIFWKIFLRKKRKNFIKEELKI